MKKLVLLLGAFVLIGCGDKQESGVGAVETANSRVGSQTNGDKNEEPSVDPTALKTSMNLPVSKPPAPPVLKSQLAPEDVAAAPEGAEKTESGISSRVLQEGTGTSHPKAYDKVKVHYSGWQTDGYNFDSSLNRGVPATFGLNNVIKGWTEGVQLMVEGEKRRFWIPGELAYGKLEGELPPIGENGKRPWRPLGQLCFDIELIKIIGPVSDVESYEDKRLFTNDGKMIPSFRDETSRKLFQKLLTELPRSEASDSSGESAEPSADAAQSSEEAPTLPLSDGEVVRLLKEAVDDSGQMREGPGFYPLWYRTGDSEPFSGWSKSMDDSGRVKSLRKFKGGKVEIQMVWYKNGQKRSEASYKDGKPNGTAVGWHENGQTQLISSYKNGKLVSRKVWNSKGEEVETLVDSLK